MALFTKWLDHKLTEAVSVNSFPTLLKAYSNPDPKFQSYNLRKTENLNNALENLNQASSAGEIANPAYQEMKSVFNSAIENAFDRINEKYFFAGKYQQLPIDLHDISYSHPQLHTINSLHKKLQKMQSKDHPAWKEANDLVIELLPLANAMEELKSKVYKGKKNPEISSKPVFSPPQAALDDVKKVRDLLIQITTEISQQQIESIKIHLKRILDSFWDAYTNNKIVYKSPGSNPISSWFQANDYNIFAVRRMTDIVPVTQTFANRLNHPPVVIKPNVEQIIQKMAESEAKEMQEAYVFKNTKKLSPIITAKSSMADARILRVSADSGSITGEIAISFKDNSKFVVRNQVVQSWSKYNKPFYRFPTTFHDVWMADGQSMKMPSEEKMHKIFAGISTPVEESFDNWLRKR